MNITLKKHMDELNMKKVSIDLFSGAGGLCTGFKWAGILPLIAVEWSDTAIKTYSTSQNAEVFELSLYLTKKGTNRRYLEKFLFESAKTLLIHGDINLVSGDLIKEILLKRFGIDCENETVDVVSGSAPCESFSIAGTRIEGDERDELFSNIVRISRAVNTKMILFDNVKGLFSKPMAGEKGAVYNYVCDTFEDDIAAPSYKLVSREKNTVLLKACDYGVPQVREIIFLVAIRRDLLTDVNFEYPEKEYGPDRKYPYVTVKEALSDLPVVEMSEVKTTYTGVKKYASKNQERFVNIVRGTLSDKTMNIKPPQHLIRKGLFADDKISFQKGPNHTKRKQELLKLIKEKETMKSAYKRLEASGELEDYRDYFPKTIYASRNRRLLLEKPSFTVTSHCCDEMLHIKLNRAITPREAARLQSFPDWYQFAGPYVQFHGDKTQDKYEQIGAAIPPLLAYALGKQIVKALRK